MIARLLASLLLVVLLGGASPLGAQAPVELSFYYPVAVGGPVTKIIDGLAADFQKENPGIHVKPIYAGTYQETIVKVLTALNNASSSLRSQASAFGSNLSIVQIRQDFSKNLINVLQTGSSNLTLADTNEEAANSQALSTRQSIAVSALALANTSQQSVLQLLR